MLKFQFKAFALPSKAKSIRIQNCEFPLITSSIQSGTIPLVERLRFTKQPDEAHSYYAHRSHIYHIPISMSKT